MKLQFEGQRLRVRIDEDELATLFAGGVVQARTHVADAFDLLCALRLSEDVEARIGGTAAEWSVHLPLAPVRELATRLPTRDGLSFDVASRDAARGLSMQFDVDVRDSARRLKAARRPEGG